MSIGKQHKADTAAHLLCWKLNSNYSATLQFWFIGEAGDALGELFQGKKFPKPLKTPHNILYSLRRFIDTNREALALPLGYRVASKTVINTRKMA